MKLTANGKTYAQPIVVRQDPRVKTPAIVMQRIYTLTRAAYRGAVDAQAAVQEAQALREQIARAKSSASGEAAAALEAFDRKIEAILATTASGQRGRGSQAGRGGAGAGADGGAAVTLTDAGAALRTVMNTLDGADVQPTALQVATVETALGNARAAMARWHAAKTTELGALNTRIASAGITIR